MLNLLPKDQKKKIVREYRIRFLIVFLALTLAGEVLSLILLAPSYLITQTRVDILNSQSVGLKVKNLNIETTKLSDIVKRTNSYINILSSSSTPTNLVSDIKIITDVLGDSIKLTNFLYRINNGQQQITVTGNAGSRQSLLDFTKKLKTLPEVASADLPVSDFAKAQNIDFSITILMNPPKK